MSTLKKLKQAIQKLSPEKLTAFRTWFVEFDAIAWDRQIEKDVATGRLEKLADEALRDLRDGRTTER